MYFHCLSPGKACCLLSPLLYDRLWRRRTEEGGGGARLPVEDPPNTIFGPKCALECTIWSLPVEDPPKYHFRAKMCSRMHHLKPSISQTPLRHRRGWLSHMRCEYIRRPIPRLSIAGSTTDRFTPWLKHVGELILASVTWLPNYHHPYSRWKHIYLYIYTLIPVLN